MVIVIPAQSLSIIACRKNALYCCRQLQPANNIIGREVDERGRLSHRCAVVLVTGSRRIALSHTILIRPFRSTDLEQTVAMWRASKRAAFPYVEVQQLYTLQNDRDYFRDVIAPECDVWLATDGEQILGLLALRDYLIDQLYVAVDAQRQRVGSALLEEAKERSPDQLRAYTFQKNAPAQAFFEKHGFEIVRSGISPPPENEPDYEYMWQPAPEN